MGIYMSRVSDAIAIQVLSLMLLVCSLRFSYNHVLLHQ